MDKTIITTSEKETFEAGVEFGKTLHPGDVVLLKGDLGSGKTTFTKGVGTILGISDRIISPTFIVLRKHELQNRPEFLFHADLYRLENADAKELGIFDIIQEGKDIVVIEWPENADLTFLKKRWELSFEHADENKRKIEFKKYE